MMSKKTFSRLSAAILLLLTVSTPVGAQEISVEAARQAAASFLKSHAAKLPAKSRKGMMKAPPKAESLQLVYTQEDQLHESPALYVFEQPKQGGFVIASADERAYPILGYNENGTFREDSLPCCLKFILEEYGKQIAEARKQNLPRHTEKTENESWQNIEPLITCAWSQGAPFNNLCPIDKNTGERCVTGCVATAMAQIMYYWKWPERGVGSYSYQTDNVEGTLTANFGETTYRWDLMKDDYEWQFDDNGRIYYDDPENAVATLMYHCGVALNMGYSSSGSGASDFIRALQRYFNYSKVSTYIYNENVLFQQSSLYKELLHGRPVGMSGSGHAYLCDGYRNDGFFHFNFGWGRRSNYGFYKWGAINGYSTSVDEFRIAPNYYGDLTDKNGYVYNILDGEAYLVEVGNVEGDIEIPAEITKNETKFPVVDMNDYVFNGNASITSVTIPNSIERIGNYAFKGCTGLTSVTIPNSVTTIGECAFRNCSGLKTMTIPNSVKSIGDYAFHSCSGLTSIEIPNSVTSIGNVAFRGCTGLTRVTVASGNNKYDSRDNCNAIIETASNTLIQGCNNTIIPNSVTRIGDFAFTYCSGLTRVTIGSSVTSIGTQAFFGCSGLTSLTIPNSVMSIGDEAFYGTGLYYNSADGVFYVDKWVCDYKGDMPENTNLVLREGTLGIADKAFRDCSGLTSINVPNSVTSIGDDAFEGCSGLTSVTIPNSVTSIDFYAFSGCSGLTNVTIGNSVETIRSGAFKGCSGLASVTSYIENPFEIYYVFEDIPSNATLYVPIGTSEKYKSTDGWKNFKNIVEIEIDGIEGVTVGDSNSSDSENAPMYNLSGQRVGKNYKGIVIKNGKKIIVK